VARAARVVGHGRDGPRQAPPAGPFPRPAGESRRAGGRPRDTD
jgi:hypothetical protein